MLWLALIFPMIAFGVLMAVPSLRCKVVWWEGLLLFLPPVIMVPIFSAMGEASMTTDTEYWGTYVTQATYYEAWDEKVSCSHPTYCTRTVRGSDGESTTETYQCGWDHLYDVDHHPERWYASISIGGGYSINKSTYIAWKKLWVNQTFKDLHRNYHSNDGDSYVTRFDGKDDHLQPYITIHTYENRIQASSSVFNFQEVTDPGLYDLHEYGDGYEAVLGDCPNKAKANKILTVANCILGSPRQLRIWMLCFKEQSQEAALMQENYWKGGNKNELVVCIGLDANNNLMWCKVFTWSEADVMKPNIRNAMIDMKTFDGAKAAKIIVTEAKANWKRKEFKDFDYVEVEIPTWTYWVTYIVTLLVTISICFFVVMNGIDETTGKSKGLKDYWRQLRNK